MLRRGKPLTRLRQSSASSRDASAVEPTRSQQNMTVTGRRSAANPAAFCAGVDGGDARGTEGTGGRRGVQGGDRVEKLAPMPDNCHAEVFEIVGVQAKQNVSDDRVLRKAASYWPRPRFPSQTPTSTVAST
jgi:hypothetical protein